MSGAANAGSSGNKLDTELNLVPFIDLLSTLVLFLLLTAVWVQVAAIEAGVDSKGKSTTSAVDQPKLLVHVTREDLRLTWPDGFSAGSGQPLPASVVSFEQLQRLVQSLASAGKKLPAAVSGDDGVDYGAVVQALDALKTAGLTAVALSTD